ncbi:pyridoxal phosphate-dependent aminotransferase [Sporanaerobacter sp. PP17-6a]|jgi:aspartate/methionine/tyrosine aminotransferase|uniref:pyridoxal phosphate-dependent aminotransferase n=1 Tax=Sporanaerobacter sp. PP17-6a TaxID=1891289 RepID=UPI0008A0186B|nr:pyridoxal phosphate-dependent aminotransferase [Sporanaerobacter sp. PP17-6a]MBE6083182.1 pyridoxal phosphate-dependent aminotransferase [Tissierellaceae bacterium]SCL83795.1 Aspartate aminotransferase [Sporanaerobacter sp. PP17-6a]
MKNKYISKRYWKDKSTPMGKVDELAKQFNDVIDLSLGDPDLITHDIIIDNSMRDAKLGYTKYTDFRGDPELREEITKFYKEEYGLTIKDEEIFVTASGCLAMYLVLEAILDDGDEVIVQTPYFTPYPQQVELARGIPVPLNTYENEDFQIDTDRLEKLITERTKAIIVNSPNNPTGSTLTPKTIEGIRDIAVKYDLIVISDDIYTSFCYEEPFIPIICTDGMKERTIIINSFSKNFTMTGWRIGNIIAPDYIIKVIQQINENVVFTAPSISQRGAIYALRNRKEVQKPIIEEYKKRVFYSADRINGIPNMSVLSPKGTFYLFVNIKRTGLSSAEASDALLKEAHVLTIPGIAFGECGEGYIRLACTVGIEKLKEAFDRIEKMEIFHKSGEDKLWKTLS